MVEFEKYFSKLYFRKLQMIAKIIEFWYVTVFLYFCGFNWVFIIYKGEMHVTGNIEFQKLYLRSLVLQ